MSRDIIPKSKKMINFDSETYIKNFWSQITWGEGHYPEKGFIADSGHNDSAKKLTFEYLSKQNVMVIFGGDNNYHEAPTKENIEEQIIHPLKNSDNPTFLVKGNHDIACNGENPWKKFLPDTNMVKTGNDFVAHFKPGNPITPKIKVGEKEVNKFIMLNHYYANFHYAANGDFLGVDIIVDSNSLPDDQAQIDWLKATLKEVNNRAQSSNIFIDITTHHLPVRGKHGNDAKSYRDYGVQKCNFEETQVCNKYLDIPSQNDRIAAVFEDVFAKTMTPENPSLDRRQVHFFGGHHHDLMIQANEKRLVTRNGAATNMIQPLSQELKEKLKPVFQYDGPSVVNTKHYPNGETIQETVAIFHNGEHFISSKMTINPIKNGEQLIEVENFLNGRRIHILRKKEGNNYTAERKIGNRVIMDPELSDADKKGIFLAGIGLIKKQLEKDAKRVKLPYKKILLKSAVECLPNHAEAIYREYEAKKNQAGEKILTSENEYQQLFKKVFSSSIILEIKNNKPSSIQTIDSYSLNEILKIDKSSFREKSKFSKEIYSTKTRSYRNKENLLNRHFVDKATNSYAAENNNFKLFTHVNFLENRLFQLLNQKDQDKTQLIKDYHDAKKECFPSSVELDNQRLDAYIDLLEQQKSSLEIKLSNKLTHYKKENVKSPIFWKKEKWVEHLTQHYQGKIKFLNEKITFYQGLKEGNTNDKSLMQLIYKDRKSAKKELNKRLTYSFFAPIKPSASGERFSEETKQFKQIHFNKIFSLPAATAA